MPKLLRRYSNLYGELSDATTALSRDLEYGPKFLNEFQDKLLFGTDICGFDVPFGTMELLLKWRSEKKISEQVFKKIARENAIKLLGL
jgi:predicted TIM-barrel fold metal-dependent hydrolase